MLPSSFLVGTDICPKSIQWTNDLQGKFVLRQELWKQWLFSWFCNKLDWLKNWLNLWSFIHNILTRSQLIKCSADFNTFLNNFKSKDWLPIEFKGISFKTFVTHSAQLKCNALLIVFPIIVQLLKKNLCGMEDFSWNLSLTFKVKNIKNKLRRCFAWMIF